MFTSRFPREGPSDRCGPGFPERRLFYHLSFQVAFTAPHAKNVHLTIRRPLVPAAAHGEGRRGLVLAVRSGLFWSVCQSFQNSPAQAPCPQRRWRPSGSLPFKRQCLFSLRKGDGGTETGRPGAAAGGGRSPPSWPCSPWAHGLAGSHGEEGLRTRLCGHNCNGNGTLPSNQMEKLFAFCFKEEIVF